MAGAPGLMTSPHQAFTSPAQQPEGASVSPSSWLPSTHEFSTWPQWGHTRTWEVLWQPHLHGPVVTEEMQSYLAGAGQGLGEATGAPDARTPSSHLGVPMAGARPAGSLAVSPTCPCSLP